MFFASTMVMVSIALVMSVIVTNVYARKNSVERCPGWFLSLAISCLNLQTLDYLVTPDSTPEESQQNKQPTNLKVKSQLSKDPRRSDSNDTNPYSDSTDHAPPLYMRNSATGISFISNHDLDIDPPGLKGSRISMQFDGSYGSQECQPLSTGQIHSKSLELNSENLPEIHFNEDIPINPAERNNLNGTMDRRLRLSEMRRSLKRCQMFESFDQSAVSSPVVFPQGTSLQEIKIPPPPLSNILKRKNQALKWKQLKMANLKKKYIKEQTCQEQEPSEIINREPCIGSAKSTKNSLSFDKKSRERIKAEWRLAAMFIDQIFFWIFLGLSFITHLTIIYQMIC